MTSARKAVFVTVMTVFLLSLSTAVTAAEQNSTKDSSINVTIAQEVAVDLDPKSVEYDNANPGSTVTSSDRGFTSIDLENVGSEYVKKVWVNATTPASDPFERGNNFDAGNFFILQPNNASSQLLGVDDEYNYVNRLEYSTWDQGEIPSYINAPADGTYNATGTSTASASNISVGRFKAGDQEYFFALPIGTSGLCDGSGTDDNTQLDSLLVAKKPHTASETNPVDFTEGTGFSDIPGYDYNVYDINQIENTGSYGLTADSVNLTVDGTSRDYDVLTKCDPDDDSNFEDNAETIRTRYNIEAGDAGDIVADDDSSVTTALIDTESQGDMLAPSEAVTFDVGVEIPRGVEQGTVNQGTLTVSVVADVNVAN